LSAMKGPSEQKMREWNQIMELAECVRETYKQNREQSEKDFEDLLELYPDDGMIYFQRALAYARYGKYKEARRDFEKAKELFPLDRWKWEVQKSIEELEQNNPDNGTIIEAKRRIKVLNNIDNQLKLKALDAVDKVIRDPISTARDLRTCEEDLVRQLMGSATKKSSYSFVSMCSGDDKSLELNINKLREINAIPKIIRNHMHTVRVIGNYASHALPKKDPEFDHTHVYSSISALVAILEWQDRK